MRQRLTTRILRLLVDHNDAAGALQRQVLYARMLLQAAEDASSAAGARAGARRCA